MVLIPKGSPALLLCQQEDKRGTQCFQFHFYLSNLNLMSTFINLIGGSTDGGEDTDRVDN